MNHLPLFCLSLILIQCQFQEHWTPNTHIMLFQSPEKNPQSTVSGFQWSISTSLEAWLILDHLTSEAVQHRFLLSQWVTPVVNDCMQEQCLTSPWGLQALPSCRPPAQRPTQTTNPLLSSRNNTSSCSPSSCETNAKTPRLHGSSLEEEQEGNRNMIRLLIHLNQHFYWHIYCCSEQLPWSPSASNFFLNSDPEDIITDHSQHNTYLFLETIRHHYP